MVSRVEKSGSLASLPAPLHIVLGETFVQVGSELYMLSESDFRAARFANAVDDVRRMRRNLGVDPQVLLKHREEFRRIISTRPIGGLVQCFLSRKNSETQLIAAWLLGMCNDRSVVPLLTEYGEFAPLPIHRAIVKALYRLNAQRECQRLAAITGDERARRLARLVPRDYRRILETWRGANKSEVPAPKRPFELLVPIGPGAPVLPKSRDLIRRFLEHIRWLLRGTVH